jgi:hypothetical protein
VALLSTASTPITRAPEPIILAMSTSSRLARRSSTRT